MATREASDVKAAGMPVPSRERDRMPDASRRISVTELNIRDTYKWHIRTAFGRKGTIKPCYGNAECGAHSTVSRVSD